MSEVIKQLVHNPKVAGSVAGVTAGLGAAIETAISWIPDDIGKLGMVIAMILSVIMIRLHLVGLRKAQLELEIMKLKEAERLMAAANREENGQPLRRECDKDVG